jgi:hypothetical protein
MTTASYTWTTPEYSYTFSPIDATTVRVESESKQAIEDFLSTVELSGPEEGTEIPTTIYEDSTLTGVLKDGTGDFEHSYFIEVSRATISLFLDFDVRYYMGVSIT